MEQKKKGVTYYQAEKLSLKDLKKTIPKEFAISNRVIEIFAWIIIFMILLSVFQIPFTSLLSPDKEEIGIGMPFAFLSFGLKGKSGMNFIYKGLILDLLIAFIVAYAINLVIGIFLKKFETGKKKRTPPELYNVGKTK